jgi:hypothetical protein
MYLLNCFLQLGLIQVEETTAPQGDGQPLTEGLTAFLFYSVAIALLAIVVIIFMVLWRWSGTSSNSGVGGQDTSRRPWAYRMLIVAILVIPVIFLGTMLLVFAVTPDTFSDATQVLAALTTVFAVIATLVGFYFGIKTSGDARDTLEDVHRNLVTSLTSTTPPTVVSVNPLPESSVVAGTINVVSATFSQDMADGTINKNTFTLARKDDDNFVPSEGIPHYNATSKTATFDPTEKPLPLGSYRATITTGVQNKAGIAMASDYVWTFQIAEEEQVEEVEEVEEVEPRDTQEEGEPRDTHDSR